MKYIDDSIDAKNTPIFTRKPIIGGNPATESNTVAKKIARVLFDLLSKTKSVKSLFCFCT